MQCSDEEISVMPIKHFYTANPGQKKDKQTIFTVYHSEKILPLKKWSTKFKMRKASAQDSPNWGDQIAIVQYCKSFCPEISNFVFSV